MKKKIFAVLAFCFLLPNVVFAQHYYVQEGDTLWKIADKNGLELKDLILMNPHIENPNMIYPKQHINLYNPHNDKAEDITREEKIEDLLDYARSLQSVTTYKFGGNNAPYEADCSSWVKHIFERFGVTLPRVSRDQAKEGEFVKFENLQKGDLLYFAEDKKNISHVGIYLGDDLWISNLSTGRDVVILSTFGTWSFDRYMWARRVI